MEEASIHSAMPERPATCASVRITVPLDAAPRAAAGASKVYPERKFIRRDSMERREALLKGNEGSRQRRRWENGKSPHVLDD